MNNIRKFEDLVKLYRIIRFNDSKSGGTVTVSSEDSRVLIQDILNFSDDFGITLESGNIVIGEDITLHISPPKLRIGQLHNTFDDYLKNGKNRIREAKYYFIIEGKYFNKDSSTPSIISNYRILLRVLALFKECSAYLDESNYELVFVESGVLKIPVNYDSNLLTKFSSETATNFLAQFAQDTHRDQKITILANTIKSMCETKVKDSSFVYLFEDFSQLIDSFNKGYNVYVSGFSYEKILDQLRVAKIEEMGKIHKVFSEIQNQILGIPLATLIVATQMKSSEGWDSQAIINTIIILGAFFFTAMVIFAVFNQWQTLSAISDELTYKNIQAETKFNAIYSDIRATFRSLRRRIIIQRVIFLVLGFFVVVGLTLASMFYFSVTPHAHDYFFGST